MGKGGVWVGGWGGGVCVKANVNDAAPWHVCVGRGVVNTSPN